MSKFITRFETTSELEIASAKTDGSFEKPHVSLTKDNNQVHYYGKDPYAGHDYVDLGLPSGTKWATMNVGASSETDYGNYYMYGKGARQYNSSDQVYSGTENPLAISADTAAQVWGGSWHTPTKAQFEELIANTTYEWTTIDGVNGGKFTAQNGNYVFFPTAGYWYDGGQSDVGSFGYYWASTPFKSGYAFRLCFLNVNKVVEYGGRDDGNSVRGVTD